MKSPPEPQLPGHRECLPAVAPARQAYLSILLVGVRFYICNGVSTIDKWASRGTGATGTSSRRSTPLNSIGLTMLKRV